MLNEVIIQVAEGIVKIWILFVNVSAGVDE